MNRNYKMMETDSERIAKRDQRLTKYRENVDHIIENKITDEEHIEAVFEQIIDYYDDEEFLELFWKLIGYVEKFDKGIGTFYRRAEEILRWGY